MDFQCYASGFMSEPALMCADPATVLDIVLKHAEELYDGSHGQRSVAPRHVCPSCNYVTPFEQESKMSKTELYEHALRMGERWMELASMVKS